MTGKGVRERRRFCDHLPVTSEFAGDPSWVFGLASADDRVRARALTRHRRVVALALDAIHWSNRVWARAGTPAPAEPHLAAEMDQARSAFRHHHGQTVFALADRLWDEDPRVRERHAPFALLYLVWERRHPDDWRAPASNLWSPWGRKELVLRRLAGHGVPQAIRPQLTDLLTDVLRGPYRCKDWWYARLVHRIRDDRFDERMRGLLTDDNPLVRLRAEFLRHVADHPEPRVTRATWHRWLADTGH